MGLNLFGSNSKTDTNTQDNRAVGDGGAMVTTGNGKIVVNKQSTEALNLTRDITKEALASSRDALAGTFAAMKESNKNAQSIANSALQTTKTDTQQIISQAVPVLIVGIIVWGVTR